MFHKLQKNKKKGFNVFQTLKAKRTWISFFAICKKLKKWEFYFLQAVNKLGFFVLQASKSQKKNKDLLFANFKNRTKKMDFNFANCVKLAKRILFLGNFEKLKNKTRI